MKEYLNSWEELYKNQKHKATWPWTDIVALTNKYIKKRNILILELGCGFGANIPFLITISNKYYGIDYSKTAINFLRKKFPLIKNNLIVGNFTKEIPFTKKFDLIIDRSSITHNTNNKVVDCIKTLKNVMKNNSIYIGVDWFSNKINLDNKKNIKNVDKFTKSNFSGILKNTGVAYFTSEKKIKDLFKDFRILHLEEKIINRKLPKKHNNYYVSWNIVVSKKS